ncbi:MAG: 50S ribosomal protein L5 [Candidatus Sungbacteria bacterium]|nr:50S ribosomal protein L5 [Candidatus Sungbacteria bacterium]
MIPMQEKYRTEVIPAMREKFGYRNAMAVPRIIKAVVNMGAGRLREEKEREEIQKYLALITGQKSEPRAAKKAIAAFKTREGLVIGYRTTLRGKRMYDFLGRLIHIALPRTRDFRGIDPASFDPAGNLTLGIKEHIVFPEMIGEDYKFLFGLEVTIVTNARRREEGVELLRAMGFPIQNKS